MSPFQSLLQSFSQMLPPGSTIFVLAAELPDGRTAVQGGALGGSPSQGRPMILAPASEGKPEALATPLTRVAALRAELGPETPLKLRDWAKELGISVRELNRAVKAEVLPHGRKPDGRDNKALTVTVGVMESYLKMVSAVEAGQEEPPTWWKEVRGSRAN
jgi:hypothetical protein